MRLARTGIATPSLTVQPTRESPIEIAEVVDDEVSEARTERIDDKCLRIVPEISPVETKIQDFPPIPDEPPRPKMIQVPVRSNKEKKGILIPLVVAALIVMLMIPIGFAWIYRRERRHFKEVISKSSMADLEESRDVDQKLKQQNRSSEETKSASVADPEAERTDRPETKLDTASTVPSNQVDEAPPKPMPAAKEKEGNPDEPQVAPKITGFFDIKFEKAGLGEFRKSESEEFDQEIESINLIGEKDKSIGDFQVNFFKDPDGESRKISIKGDKILGKEASGLNENNRKEIGDFYISENSKKIIFILKLNTTKDNENEFINALKSCVLKLKYKQENEPDKYLLLDDPNKWGLSFPKKFEQTLIEGDPVIRFDYPNARQNDFGIDNIRFAGVAWETTGLAPEFEKNKMRIKIGLSKIVNKIEINKCDSLKSLMRSASSKKKENDKKISNLQNTSDAKNLKEISDLESRNAICKKLINLCDAKIDCDVYLTIGGRKYLIDIAQKKGKKSK